MYLVFSSFALDTHEKEKKTGYKKCVRTPLFVLVFSTEVLLLFFGIPINSKRLDLSYALFVFGFEKRIMLIVFYWCMTTIIIENSSDIMQKTTFKNKKELFEYLQKDYSEELEDYNTYENIDTFVEHLEEVSLQQYADQRA